MPTYDYVCRACEHRFEHFQSMQDALLRKCPKCKRSKLERLIGAGAGILFKGSGFYETDYKQKSGGPSGSSGSSGAGDSKGGDSKGGDSKGGGAKGDGSQQGGSTSSESKGGGKSDGQAGGKTDGPGGGQADAKGGGKDASGKPAEKSPAKGRKQS